LSKEVSLFNIEPESLYNNIRLYYAESMNILFIDKNFKIVSNYPLDQKQVALR
jgi:hypothetical protein